MQVFVILETVWAQECCFSTPNLQSEHSLLTGPLAVGHRAPLQPRLVSWTCRSHVWASEIPDGFECFRNLEKWSSSGACAKGALLRLYSRGVRLKRQNSCFFTCFHSPIDASGISHASELLLSLPQSIFSSFFRTTQRIHEPGRIFSSRCGLPAPPTWGGCAAPALSGML